MPNTLSSFVMLVAFDVQGTDRRLAELALHKKLVPILESQDPSSPVECWWVAEDDRQDGSDNDSAVFVSMGLQAQASRLLERELVSPAWNITPADPTGQELIRRAALAFLHSKDPEGLDLAELADALGVDHGDVEALG